MQHDMLVKSNGGSVSYVIFNVTKVVKIPGFENLYKVYSSSNDGVVVDLGNDMVYYRSWAKVDKDSFEYCFEVK